MKINIHQGETKVFDLLAVEDDLVFDITKLSEVQLPTHTHEVQLKSNCGVFEVGENIFLKFAGVNECFTGCYEIKFMDGCGTTIGFDAEGCITPQDGVEIIPTCCGGVVTKTNKIAQAYKPLELKACDSIISHVRVVSSTLIRKPPFVGSYVCDSNVFYVNAKHRKGIRMGAVVEIDGQEFTICGMEKRSAKTLGILMDRDFMDSNSSAKMKYSRNPIATLTGGVGGPTFCSTCGVVSLSLSSEDSYKLIPGVIYHWDILSKNKYGTKRIGGGTLELEEVYTY